MLVSSNGRQQASSDSVQVQSSARSIQASLKDGLKYMSARAFLALYVSPGSDEEDGNSDNSHYSSAVHISPNVVTAQQCLPFLRKQPTVQRSRSLTGACPAHIHGKTRIPADFDLTPPHHIRVSQCRGSHVHIYSRLSDCLTYTTTTHLQTCSHRHTPYTTKRAMVAVRYVMVNILSVDPLVA